jgi:hypothetical protein
MTYRLLAVLGSIAYGIRQAVGSLLSFAGLRDLARFAAPALIVALIAAAGISARDTAAILASRPDVTETTLSEVAAYDGEGGSIWFEFDALLAVVTLETPADLGTFFYLARDPADPASGLLVRSNLNDDFVRERVITVRLVGDEAAVSEATERLGPLGGGYSLEGARYAEELDTGGDPEDAFLPSELSDEPDGTELLLNGRVLSPRAYAACAVDDGCEGEDAAWLYYFADPNGGDTIVLRSPHAPDAIPVRLQGLYQRDTYDLGAVLASDWYADLDADVPTERAFFAGSRPPIMVPASWIPTIIFAALALLLLASHVVGYPVFAEGGRVEPARELPPGGEIDVQITGRLAREQGSISLDRSPGAVERLTVEVMALRMWRYGLLPRELSRRDAEQRYLSQAAGETDRLVVHERDQSALVAIERDQSTVAVRIGRLYRIGRSSPAVHLRHGVTDAYLTVRTDEVRDRIAAEIQGEATIRKAAS